VVRIDWDEALPNRFAAKRRLLEHLDRTVQEWRVTGDRAEADHLRYRVERILSKLDDHAAVELVRDDGGRLHDAQLLEEHVEKDHVRWWVVDELHEVLRARGRYQKERFRPYFLPALRLFLNEVGGGALRSAGTCRKPSPFAPPSTASPSF
jgi:hypothetical protein